MSQSLRDAFVVIGLEQDAIKKIVVDAKITTFTTLMAIPENELFSIGLGCGETCLVQVFQLWYMDWQRQPNRNMAVDLTPDGFEDFVFKCAKKEWRATALHQLMTQQLMMLEARDTMHFEDDAMVSDDTNSMFLSKNRLIVDEHGQHAENREEELDSDEVIATTGEHDGLDGLDVELASELCRSEVLDIVPENDDGAQDKKIVSVVEHRNLDNDGIEVRVVWDTEESTWESVQVVRKAELFVLDWYAADRESLWARKSICSNRKYTNFIRVLTSQMRRGPRYKFDIRVEIPRKATVESLTNWSEMVAFVRQLGVRVPEKKVVHLEWLQPLNGDKHVPSDSGSCRCGSVGFSAVTRSLIT